ncbi:MAG: outer membrane lipoprotein chaperone LolA [Legionella sp.]|nr:outer membrane lipoprotein chaperone LolA [Legionella sp.]
MIIKKLILGCLVFGVILSQAAWSDNAGEVLWDKLRAIESMQADFKQKVTAKKRVLSQSAGKMALERPKHFRWQTKTPMEQVLVADGQKFWLYDVDLEQVTVRPQAGLEGAAAGLFLGDNKARFLHDFKVTAGQVDKQDVFKLQAIAKQANIQKMTLRFDGALLRAMDLYDQLGQRTAIEFTQVENNLVFSPDLFGFSPPKGVDVVTQ